MWLVDIYLMPLIILDMWAEMYIQTFGPFVEWYSGAQLGHVPDHARVAQW
jgi:hypothetical protein